MEQNDERCENCRYFELIDAEMEVGHCVRYAPKPADNRKEGTYYATWPHVTLDLRCGEFEAE